MHVVYQIVVVLLLHVFGNLEMFGEGQLLVDKLALEGRLHLSRRIQQHLVFLVVVF